MIQRRYTFKLYPSKAQQDSLLSIKRVHCDLYNAALEERIDAYRRAGISVNYHTQAKSLTLLRKTDEITRSVNAASQQVTLKRLDLAFQHFFRRVKSGETPGFPRFKSFRRYPGWGYKQHGDGFRFHQNDQGHGRLRLHGVGTVKARGLCRVPGTVKICEILHKNDQWYASITFNIDNAERECTGTEALGFDWGVNTLLVGVTSSGVTVKIDNPRWFKESAETQAKLQQDIARKKRGSQRWRKACKKLSRFKSAQAARRKDHHHKVSADLAGRFAGVCGEELSIKSMTRTAKGTIEKPGENVKQKTSLNREILDTAPGVLYQMISYKVEETGGWFVKSPTQQLKPSQRCPACWQVSPKTLNDRQHDCPACGHSDDRDRASAEVNLRWLENELQQVGNRPSGAKAPKETTSFASA